MESWRAKFLASSLTHLFTHASDHALIILHIKKAKKICPRFSRCFKFEEVWFLWEDCEQVIHDAWNKEARANSGLTRIKERIAMCGVDLHAWGSTRTHPNVEKIKRLQAKVEALGKGESTEDSKIVLLVASKELDDLLLKQEIYWAQCSRISWLKHEDKNTKFLHSKASQRKRRNFIEGIKDQANNWVTENDWVAEVTINYFENMFKAGDCDRMEECLEAIHHRITPKM